jgi:hypothetical protein
MTPCTVTVCPIIGANGDAASVMWVAIMPGGGTSTFALALPVPGAVREVAVTVTISPVEASGGI